MWPPILTEVRGFSGGGSRFIPSTELTLKGSGSARASLRAGPTIGSHSEPTILFTRPRCILSLKRYSSNNILKMRGKVVT